MARFRVKRVTVEPRPPAGMASVLGGSLAAAAYLVDAGWRALLASAIALWSLLAAGRLWIYIITAGLASRGIAVESPRSAQEGSRFSVSVRLPRAIPPGGLRVSARLPKGLRLEGVRPSLGGARLEVSGRIGVWCIDGLDFEAYDPLGAFRFAAEAHGRECVTITPRPVAVPAAAKLFGARKVEGSGRRGSGIDYYTFREYQFGDEPRMIEWKATARLRMPVVKETEEARAEEAVAIAFIGCLEDYDLEAPDSMFERAARIAFSLAKAAVEAGERVHLYVPPLLAEKPLVVEGPAGLGDAGEAIARGGVRCGDGVDVPPLEGYERAVIVASRRIGGQLPFPLVTPEDLQ